LDLPVSAQHSVHENDVPLLDEQASDQADRDGKHISIFGIAIHASFSLHAAAEFI
jgi:hypothetical protein